MKIKKKFIDNPNKSIFGILIGIVHNNQKYLQRRKFDQEHKRRYKLLTTWSCTHPTGRLPLIHPLLKYKQPITKKRKIA